MINWSFDSNEYNPDGHFTPIPAGDYRVRIEEAEETQSKAGDPMIKLTLAVSGMKKTLWFYLVFPTNANDPKYATKKMMCNQNLGSIWESFNLTVGDMNVLNWRGKVGAARVKQELNKERGEMVNAVSYFLTRKRQESLAPWKEPEGGAATSPAPAAQMGDYGSLRDEQGNVNLPF